MNKNLYRIIFSKARNMFIAVGENSKSQTKAAGESAKISTSVEAQDNTALHQHWVVKSLVASISLWMPLAPVYAQIQADSSANAANRPVIGVGVNNQGQNVPVVNIQTPVNGVSHNKYKQMDVLNNGVVLNNSRTGAGSVIVGSVGANPFLAKGEARLILNEINSTAATRFEGNLEVAGQRADVIIANPSGINIKGGGFINANKAIFSTGKPQLNADGSLKQFVVDQGKVTVSANTGSTLGLGGNNNNADYVDIYARALELNAQLHANQDINVITGANTISSNLESIEGKTSTAAAPALAVDIKNLGGMYANNIYLMGNEKGLGVSNAGILQAVNNIVVTNTGKIVHSGTISTTDKMNGLVSVATTGTGTASDIAVSGSINSYGLISVDSANDLNLTAKDITVNYDATTKNSAALIVSAKENINLATGTKINNLSTAGDLYIDAKGINLAANSELRSNRGSATINADENLISNSTARLVASQDLSVLGKGKLALTGNTLQATLGSINLQVDSSNTQGLIDVQAATVNAGKNLNIYSSGDVNLKNLTFVEENSKSKIKNIKAYSGQNLTWDNSEGLNPNLNENLELKAENDLTILGKGIFRANKSIDLGGDNIKIKSVNLNTTLNDISITAKNNIDLNYTNLKSVDGNLNFSAENGYIKSEGNNLNTEQGSLILISKGQQNFTTTNFESAKDLVLTTTSENGNILIDQGNGWVPHSMQSTKGNVIIDSKGRLDITKQSYDSVMAISGNKIELSSKNGLNLDAVKLSSKENLSLYSDKDILINTIIPDDLRLLGKIQETIVSQKHVAISSKEGSIKIGKKNIRTNAPVVGLKADGVISIKSKFDQNYQNTILNAGAITLHSEAGSINNSDNFRAMTTKSTFLDSDKELKKINGDLNLYAKKDIQLNAIDLQGLAYDKNVQIKPILSSQGLLDIRAEGGVQVTGKAPPAQTATWDQRKLDRAYLRSDNGINILAGTIMLNAIDLKNNSAVAPINITSSTGDILIDAMRYDVDRGQLDLGIPIQNRRDQLIASGKQDAATLNEIQQLNGETTFYFSRDLNGVRHQSSIIDSAQNINLVSKNGTLIRASELYAKGSVNLEAQGLLDKDQTGAQASDYIDTSILVDGVHDIYKNGVTTNPNYEERSDFYNSIISGDKGINIKSTGLGKLNWVDNPALLPNFATISSAKPLQLKRKLNDGKYNIVLNGAELISSGGDVNIQSNANIVMESNIDEIYKHNTSQVIKKYWYGKKKSTETYSQSQIGTALPTTILANNINLKASGDIDFYSTLMKANDGNINIVGENLYFLTSNNSASSNSTTKKSSSIFGTPLNKSKTISSRSQISQLPVKLVGDYLSTESKNDTVFVGTEFNYLKNATVKAGGSIALLGATDTINQALKVEKSNTVWQSMQDKGSITETAKLPSFNGPVAPQFEANGGLTVQVPIVSGKNNDVRTEVIKLSNQPGSEYLKGLIARNDVNWEAVKLAQESWDYKSQGLTGAGAAIIAIIVVAATAGAGVTAVGALGGTASTLGGSAVAMTQAAITTLATQASVSLINSGGDITKTLNELGSKESVRGLATSIVTAGLLSQVSTALNLKPDSTYFPDRLMNNFTNSVGSTLVQTAINGGNLEDNLQNALLAGLAGALQGELASQIGNSLDKVDPNIFEYVIHKVAHAAAGCAVATVTTASCEAGAIGAGVGEIVAGLMIPEGKTALDLTDDERTRIKDTSKIIAGTTAAFAGYDVNTAANSANVAVENNTLGKVVTTAGKAAYKVARKISDMPAAARANLKPSEIAEMLRKEGVQGVIDIGDNLLTLISPTSTVGDRAFALIDLAIGVDLKAGKNVDILKVDQKVLVKNLGTSTTKNAIIAAAKESNLKNLDLPINGKVFKPDANLSSGAAVYKGASNEDIYTAFKDIAGIRTLPSTGNPMYQTIKGKTSLSGQPGYIIRVPQADGSTVVLRNFSLSQTESQARFTIDIQKPAGMKVNKLELKFQ